MASVLITGGTGMIGKRISTLLIEKGYEVIILTREHISSESMPSLKYYSWDINNQIIDPKAIESADYIIHLAGAGVADKRWTETRKKEIVESRINSSKLIVNALTNYPNKVKAVISASAIGWYADKQLLSEEISYMHTEAELPDNSFLGNTCKLWEESILPVEKLGKRLIRFRIGIVLSNKGGALRKFLKPLKFGIAPIMGNGKQIMSWIHIEDLCRLFVFAIENQKLKGVFNAVSPEPVSNLNFIKKLAAIANKRWFFLVHIPSIILKIVLGKMSIEILKSTNVSALKIQTEGFVFNYPNLENALKKLIKNG
jgi:uncharacterized protein (TIGR01777 family)